jgi:cytochrome c5
MLTRVATAAHAPQVASFSIAFNQVKNAWGEIFTGTCAHCHGAGSVICPRCSGTKDRRSRPAAVSVTALGFVDGPDFQ